MVEFSWVFPAAAIAVVALMYLSFLLFFYVYSFHLAELTADEALHVMQNSVETAPLETAETEAELQERIRKLSFLPGVHFQPEFHTGVFGKKIEVKISCSYLGKRMFSVKAERKGLSPVKYARKIDFANFVKRMC